MAKNWILEILLVQKVPCVQNSFAMVSDRHRMIFLREELQHPRNSMQKRWAQKKVHQWMMVEYNWGREEAAGSPKEPIPTHLVKKFFSSLKIPFWRIQKAMGFHPERTCSFLRSSSFFFSRAKEKSLQPKIMFTAKHSQQWCNAFLFWTLIPWFPGWKLTQLMPGLNWELQSGLQGSSEQNSCPPWGDHRISFATINNPLAKRFFLNF